MIGLQYQAEIPPYLGEYNGDEKGKVKLSHHSGCFLKVWPHTNLDERGKKLSKNPGGILCPVAGRAGCWAYPCLQCWSNLGCSLSGEFWEHGVLGASTVILTLQEIWTISMSAGFLLISGQAHLSSFPPYCSILHWKAQDLVPRAVSFGSSQQHCFPKLLPN